MFDSFNYRKMGQETLSAVERKRNRDRRAQQKLRERRHIYIQELDEQVAHCKEHHGSGSIVSLSQQLRDLELENTMLRERANKMAHLANSVCQTLSQMQNLVGGRSAGIFTAVGYHEEHQATSSLDSVSQTSRTSHLQVSELHRPTPEGLASTATPDDNSQEGAPQDFVSQWTNRRPLDAVQYPRSQDMDAPRSSSGYSSSLAARTHCSSVGNDNTYQTPQRPTLIASYALPSPSTDGKDADSGSCNEHSFAQDPHYGKRDELPSTSLSSKVERRNLPLTQNLRTNNTASLSKNPVPPWYRLPNSDINHPMIRDLSPMTCLPETIASAPAVPNPIDILFGSRQNPLANEIHKIMRKLLMAEPERLANGWLIYVYVKWRAFPSEASFNLVPAFLRPVAEQISEEHLSVFDVIYWPTLRLNLMQKRKDDPFYDPRELTSAISCCAKVRWPWGKEILVTTEQGNLEIDPDFFKAFTRLDCWGLTSDFINRYLPLLKGLDVDRILYTIP